MRAASTLCLFLLLSLATPTLAQTIGGKYSVEGVDFDGSRYSGTATIEMTSSNTCRISWETGTSSTGLCMIYGNAFSAAYAIDSGVYGLLVYEIKDDGTLDGIWTIADTAGSGSETLTPIR